MFDSALRWIALLRRALSDGPHLDGAHAGQRAASREGDRVVKVVDVDEHIPAELLARLRERPVGQQALAVAHANAGGRGHWMQRRSEEHTSELQSLRHLVCRLLLE